MGNKYFHQQGLSLTQQSIFLKQTYSKLIQTIKVSSGVLTCIMEVRPSDESIPYLIKIVYKYTDGFPKVWLLSPSIRKMSGKYPHHIYDWDKDGHPRLCVYYPSYREWTSSSNIATTFIPWIITWLNAYEYWLITGEWHYDESPRNNSGKK